MSDVNAAETLKLTPAQEKARNKRGLLLALALFSFVVLVFVITLVRLGENAAAVSKSRDFSNPVKYFADDGTEIDANGEVIGPVALEAPEADKEETSK